MAITDLGKWMITNGGNYSPEATYEQLTMVMYDNSTYITLKTVTGITPTNDGINYILMAQGFDATALDSIEANDTSGLLGESGNTVSAQSLIDYLADAVATKLLKKTDIATTIENSTSTVPASSLLYQLNSDFLSFSNKSIQESDIDNISQNGFYKIENNPSLMIHITWDTNYMAQLMFPYGNTQIARFRNKYAGTWGDWWDLKSLSNLFTVQPFFGTYVYNGVSTQEVTVPENRLTGNQWKIIAICQDAGAAIHQVSDAVPGSFKVDLESAVTSARINYCAFNLA